MEACLTLTLKDFLTIFFQAGMFAVAITALTTWQRQLRGAATHSVALQLATRAKALSYQFFEARSPLVEGWEFPPTYYAVSGRDRTNGEEADGWQHVYANRWKQVWPDILKLARMRAKVGAVLGDEVADAAEKLARVAKQWKFWIEHDIERRRAGPAVVAMWTDQAFVRRTRDSVLLPLPADLTDRYSREFIAARDRLLNLVRPQLS